MAEDSSKTKQKQAEPGDNVKMPDIVELWKELYFNTEESWASATRELIASKSFINVLDQIRDQYLSLYEVSQQNMDQLLEANPLPSKRDVARIAELIIGLEDKIDDFDLHFANNISKLTSSMIKLVEFQELMKQEISELKQQNASISKRFDTVNRKLDNINKRFDTVNRKLNAVARAQEHESGGDKPATTFEKEQKEK
ncbi:MAG TPA: hypothetical protein GXX58_06185 [Gelria sp.]|nr:hypothetical protein [Gelria sp.]